MYLSAEICLPRFCPASITGNGLQIDVGGLLKLPQSIRTNVYVEDKCLLARCKIKTRPALSLSKGAHLNFAPSDDRFRPLAFIYCACCTTQT